MRAPTIPEDENESAMSSKKTTNNISMKSIDNPALGRPKSQASVVAVNSPMTINKMPVPNEDKNEMVERNKSEELKKQNTPVILSTKLADINPEAVDVFIPDPTPKADISEDIKDEERPLEQSVQDKSKVETPRIGNDDSLHYFESRDPDPKKVTPLGGKGPTLTKTMVKPPLANSALKEEPKKEEPIKDESVKPESPPIEDIKEEITPQPVEDQPPSPKKPESELLGEDEDEIRKLEEEVARLQKEAEETVQENNIGETEEIAEQSYMIDGKRKRKKKKKKKRKKIGGGEETIADITIADESLDEDTIKKDIPLNPVVKKKVKKAKKKPQTELGPVEEDSKEQSTVMDLKKTNTLNSLQISNAENSSRTVSSVKENEDIFEEEKKEKAISGNNLAQVKSKPSTFKSSQKTLVKAETVEETEGNVQHIPNDENIIEEKQQTPIKPTEEDEIKSGFISSPEKESSPMKPHPENKKIIDISKNESPEKKPKLLYLDQQAVRAEQIPVLSTESISPEKQTDTHEKSTEDQSRAPKFSVQTKNSEKPIHLKKIKTVCEKNNIHKLTALTDVGQSRHPR